jgi:integrase
MVASQRAERTNFDYRHLWMKHVAPRWGHYPVKSLAPTDIASWITALQKDYKSSTVKKIVTILSQVLDWAVADQRIVENPLKRAKALSASPLVKSHKVQREKVLLTHEQVSLLADAVNPWYREFVLFLAYTGLRFGEATALQVGDVNLLKRRILVRRAWSNVKGQLIERPCKNSQVREVPLPEFLAKCIEERISVASSKSDLVFTTATGAVIRNERFRRDVLQPALDAAGLPHFTPHGFRHTYAALAVQAGTNPKTLQKALGHSDIRLTMDTYGGIFDDDLDTLSEQLQQASLTSRLNNA